MEQLQSQFEFIADGLAEKGYAVVDGFLAQHEVEAVRQQEIFSTDALKKSGVGNTSKQINEGIRGDYIKWIDKELASERVLQYLHRMDSLRQFLNQALYLSLKDFEVHLALYPPGSFYKRHLDQFKTDDHRKISVICYLNPDWKESEGGQLRMYLPEILDFYPIAGRLVVFRSDTIEHEVLPATRERCSITGWLLDQVAELRHL